MDTDQRIRALVVTLRYQGRDFTVRDEFLTLHMELRGALHLWEDGNWSCDCNRSMMIREQCDPTFPELPCGDTIEIVGKPIGEPWPPTQEPTP